MRRRYLCPVVCCFLIVILLFFAGYVLQFLQKHVDQEEERVKEWQKGQQLENDTIPLKLFPTTTTTPEEDPTEWAPLATKGVPTTEEITTRTPSTTTTPTTSSITSTPSPTPSTTTSSSTTTRIYPWTLPTSVPPVYVPERHRYGQDRLHHHYNHHHHHHHETSSTSTTPEPTTTFTTTTTATTTTTSPITTTMETTTRIRITTPRYQPSSTSISSSTIYNRITIPAHSSYRNPYIKKIEVTSSTYRTPQLASTTTTSRHQHHRHHHNRTHINIHSHHSHHLPYPHFPYPGPGLPDSLFPSTTSSSSSSTTTTTTTAAPTTEAAEESTTSGRHHHHGHHHHHHHHSSSSSSSTTVKPTTTTTRQSELDRWGFVESVEDVSVDEESSSTSSTTTTTTASTSTTTRAEEEVTPRRLPDRPERPRHRQPEPTQAPVKRVEREVTLVTGFLDIGRGEWDIYRRPLETYHQFMETLLTLQNNFVVFTDESSYDFVIKTRTKLKLMDRTKVYKITLNDLPLYGYINEAKKIIDDELKNETFYRTVADLDMRTHPESISAEYNIVVNSKTHFLHNVTMENPFDSEHFVWLDAGYGHANENHFPYSYHWRPALPDGKISLIKVTPYFDTVSDYDLKRLYRKNVALLSGGFIAGDKHSIGQLHSIIHRKFIQLIYQNHVDDDQTLLTLAVNSYPHLFHVVLGDWFDAFRLFAADPEVQMG
ncbi:unnamed protein product [Caenorhabditis sp. 36 PRJEB53466]|nr:unnamed protein product [Caenorhabditis sp. 36 PRJEB53466]